MRPIHKPKTRTERRFRRHRRVRRRINGTAERPRLVVFRSLKHIYAQLVDDEQRRTLIGVSDLTKGVQAEGSGKVGMSRAVGKLIGERAKAQGIGRVVFDRGGYPYHGRVKAVADGAREAGLEF
ncbi:MAG TPA: 50S ribosomal protein L18 [Gemmatimonadales bacterium]